jgi:hypothetical protein
MVPRKKSLGSVLLSPSQSLQGNINGTESTGTIVFEAELVMAEEEMDLFHVQQLALKENQAELEQV